MGYRKDTKAQRPKRTRGGVGGGGEEGSGNVLEILLLCVSLP